MSSTFKFHSQINESVPWQAMYTFPSQSTRVNKQTVKLRPKTGTSYTAGQTARIEFPADNYFNALNSVLLLDVTVAGTANSLQRGGAHNLISRLRINYGSMVIEDIQDYKTLVRIFTEAAVQQDYMTSTGSVLDGMFDMMEIAPEAAGEMYALRPGNIPRSATIATLDTQLDTSLIPAHMAGLQLSASRRRYALNLMSGLLTCKKLIPLKFMAAQLSIELTFAPNKAATIGATDDGSYTINDLSYLAEMVEFDSAYDTAFYAGLQMGVPLKFSSWHYHSFNLSGTTAMLQIHERSRSVKAALAVIKSTDVDSTLTDSDRFFFYGGSTYSSGAIASGTTGALLEFQWRVGGRYYPSQPVDCQYGASEALVELQKTMNSLGDYTRAGNINYTNWTEGKFIMSADFENTDVMPDTISGINAEEQSDIALSLKFNAAVSGKKVDVFMHYDAMLIVRDGNLVDLVM